MTPVSLFLTPTGRIPPRVFAIAVTIIYVAMFCSQMLLGGHVTGRYGLIPFGLAQAALAWIWYVLHANRLRDAGREAGLAIALALLYALAIILLIMVVQFLASTDTGGAGAESAGNALQLFVVVAIFWVLLFDPTLGGFGYVVLGFLFLVMTPVVLALIFSIWVGTRPAVPHEP